MEKYNIKELKEKIRRCKKIEVNEVNINDVDDLSEVKISRKKSKEEKILYFLSQVENPYVFKVNGHLVQIGWQNSRDCLTNVLEILYKWIWIVDNNVII